MKVFDCVIVGGGMVGATSALSLAQLGLSVAVVEKSTLQAFEKDQPFDLRVSAISLGSQYLLEQVGAWSEINEGRLCPYNRLGVWENASSYTEFSAEEINKPYLGHIIENRLIQLALWNRLEVLSNITLFRNEILCGIEEHEDSIEIALSQETIKAKLLIGADGANSQVRELAGIGITGWDYQQSAMLINVKTDALHQDITWQQFKKNGPVALLPLPSSNASLVWYDTRDNIARLSKLSNEVLAKEVSEHFPKRLGHFVVVDKGAFPLTRRHANNYYSKGIVLIGDAAHTISPMAGQGVNLGFKDVNSLKTVIAKAIGEGRNWHNESILKEYECSRRPDNLLMMSSMDMLYKAFSHPSKPVSIIRNTVLKLANRAGYLKREALKYASGL